MNNNVSHLIKDDNLKLDVFEDICKTIYYTTGIPVTVLNKDNTQFFSYGTRNEVYDFFKDVYKDLDSHIASSLNKNEVFVYTSPYEFSFITVVISSNNFYYGSLLLGPILLSSPTEHLINEIVKKNNLQIEMRNTLKPAYDNMQVITQPRSYYIYKALKNVVFYPMSKTYMDIEEKYSPDDLKVNINITNEETPSKHNFSLEQLFLSKVTSGDIEKVKDLFQKNILTQYLGSYGPNKLRSAKNLSMIFTSHIARASIAGGVDSEKALLMSDFYINEIESTFKYEDLVELLEKIVINFTNSVLQISGINHVSVIRKASKYVNMHLSEAIRLNDVADFVGLSPNYFSSLFKKEMNISFADYVNQARIKESQYLLQTTNYSIVDIAVSVGYNNQNYFTTMFRKFSGITPKQFRMRASK